MKYINKRGLVLLFAFLFSALFASAMLYARAGGAGGDSGGDFSGGSSGGGDAGSILILIYYIGLLFVWIWVTLPFPINLIVIAAIAVGIIIAVRKAAATYRESSVLNDLPTGLSPKKAKGIDAFLNANPDFDEAGFRDKVGNAFMQIQQAWMDQDLSQVRKFLSDGVYQRFNTQFKMMQLLQQKNVLSDIEIKNIYIDAAESDGAYDILHVGIFASMNDLFECKLDPSMNSRGTSEFVEYWSFIRKKGVSGKDIYSTNNCPACGAQQKGHGELSKCEYCGTLINSGEYDWVLSEITQSDDYVSANPKAQKARNLSAKTRALLDANADFAVQNIEDKASNGFLQILTARALNDASVMRRFVSDKLFEKISATFSKAEQTAYNRIYLNDVTLVGVKSDEEKNYLSIAVKYTYQRIGIQGTKLVKTDPILSTGTDVLIMSRDKNAKASKGSVYAHICPACGGTLKDSTDIRCQYCGSVLNSTSNEWIIDDILTPEEYHSSMKNDSYDISVDPNLIDSMYDVRDFALNNVMVILTSDGEYSDDEQKFFEELSDKWGYNVDKIQGMFMMAKNGLLSVRMPEKQKDRRKIYSLMEKAAAADGKITSHEQAILDQIKTTYLS